MRNSPLFIVLCILFTGFVSFSSRAQETPAMPENFFVMEEFVAPSQMQEFYIAQQEAVDLWKKYELDVPIYTYRTAVNSYYWVIPIQSFASLDVLFQKVGEMVAKMKEGGYDADKEFRDLSTSRHTILHWVKDLSYHPNGNMGQTADKPYCEWTFVSLRSGHEAEAAEVVKKYIEFYDSIEESEEWDVYSVSLGFDTPMWVLMFRAESELAMREQEKKMGDKYQDTFRKLWTEFGTHVRKFENQKGWFLPDWSLNVQE